MQDDYIRSRGFALTLARRAVNDLRRDEFRQLRNYVDLCQALAQKTKYSSFFVQAQQVLQQADSLYYTLIRCLLDRVDNEQLCAFGVNFGLGGIVYGAAHMKEEIESTGRPAAWLNTANCASLQLEKAVSDAEEAGKYVWVLYAQDVTALQSAIALTRRHPFAAFLLVVSPALILSIPVESFDGCRNLSIWLLLLAPVLEPETIEAAQALRERKMLFGFAVLLKEEDVAVAINPEWLQEMSRWAPFCLYARMAGMKTQTAQQLRRCVVHSRTESATPLLVFDWDGDLHIINKSVSDQAVVGAPIDADLPFPFSR